MALRGCLLSKGSNQTGADYSGSGANVTWDTEIRDTDGFHSGSDELITIPAAVNGGYGIFTAQMSLESWSGQGQLQILRNTGGGLTTFKGMGFSTNSNSGIGTGQSASQNWIQCQSAPVVLTTGNTYAAHFLSGDNAIDVEASRSSFGLRVLTGLTTQRTMAALNANHTTQNYTTATAVPFDGADIFDTDSVHDPSSSNTKFIIPSGLNNEWAVFRGGVQTSLDTGATSSIAIRKNGSYAYNGFGGNVQTLTGAFSSAYAYCVTQPIQLATADEFELVFWKSADTSITLLSATTFLSMQVVS